ncbi:MULTISPECIES: sigma factor-like helix-turn-helix DNA-binding protein [Halomicrobium]|uniref:Sigma-70 family RNA polymerase sigma factor n=1 Tax=Halomicrobium mukohataei TaxID=57705 RepID=A0A847TZS4_9EURY|nr:sigma factor-like helix-turn-helix DNA-binding protein [Halomicrobium sp. LC1Hm]NLV08823.1 sigma-70 family RNA polymerase sigma factor [Halomicrobium mukohataei]QGA84117.1 RNA polymerase, sigma-24 subunit, ECF subfamily [Halomicrobium sp. LC1Hm]
MRYQSSLFEYEEDLSPLSDAQQEVYEAVEQDGFGVREYARKTGRSPGTVGNLLRRARRRLGGDAA